MGIKIYQADAFTGEPFRGNPAAVCILSEPAEDSWMQKVAREMNLSETAFVHKQENGFGLRWFTPAVEVDLCGHATLAAAHILWETAVLSPSEQAFFHTRSGPLRAWREEGMIQMDFPATPDEAAIAPEELGEALGVRFLHVARSAFDYLVEVESETALRNLKPDFLLLKTMPVRGFIATSRADSPGYDFASRFFAPGAGVDEDPVTGSAHCTLGPFWQKKLEKDAFVAYQASDRGGIVQVRVAGDRVQIGGQAVTILRGELINTG